MALENPMIEDKVDEEMFPADADSWYAFINPKEETDWIEELRKLAAETTDSTTN